MLDINKKWDKRMVKRQKDILAGWFPLEFYRICK